MTLRSLRTLPLALAALVWAAGAVLLMANLLLPALGQGSMKLAPALAGVTAPEKAVPTWDGVLHGTYQATYARLVGTRMPLYPTAVRLRNQVQYSLFGASGVPRLIVGRGPSLFEDAYATEYCARNLATWHRDADGWAAQIRQIQDAMERRGKAFLYELTPSKVSQYPDILPAGYTCPASPADRTGLVPAWLGTLRANGVHVVDTTAVLTAAHGAYPFRLYSPGGAHWNAVGAALAMQAVTAELNRLVPGGGFVPFTFQWHMIRHAYGLDVDVARLMNLLWPFPARAVPAVDLQPGPAPEPCPDTKVVLVGGSFGHALLENLLATTCNPPAVEYEYWRVFRLFWSKQGPVLTNGVDPAQRARDILAADVLVYEENEQVLPHPPQGQALWEFLVAGPAAASSSPAP